MAVDRWQNAHQPSLLAPEKKTKPGRKIRRKLGKMVFENPRKEKRMVSGKEWLMVPNIIKA